MVCLYTDTTQVCPLHFKIYAICMQCSTEEKEYYSRVLDGIGGRVGRGGGVGGSDGMTGPAKKMN